LFMDPGVPKSFQPVLLYQFNFPKTKKIVLQAIFRTDDPLSKENLSKTTSTRDEFVNALEGGNSSIVMSTLERYLPQLFGLVVAVEENPKLRLKSPLAFSWTCSFTKKVNFYTCYTYRFEVIMSLITYAFAHINRACDIISISSDSSFEEDSKKAVALLRTASGIFEYVQTRELPRWLEPPVERPIEVNSNICQALSDYCLAIAQQLTVRKGLSGSTSKLVLSKLSTEIWNKLTRVENVFKGLAGYKDFNPSFKALLSLGQGIGKASTYKYMGESVYGQGKYGMAVTMLNISSESLKSVWNSSNSALLPKLTKEITNAQDDIEHVKRSYNNENNNIYFQSLVEENQIEIPEAKNLITTNAWVPPPTAYQHLT